MLQFIGGKWTPPVKGDYFEVTTPTTGKVFTSAARGTGEDVEAALDAAHKASGQLLRLAIDWLPLLLTSCHMRVHHPRKLLQPPGAPPPPPRAPTSS